MGDLNGLINRSDPSRGPKQLHVDKRVVGDAVGTVLLTPSVATRRLVITDLVFSLDLAGTVTVFSDTDAEGHRLLDLDVGDNASGPSRVFNFARPVALPMNESLKVTNSGGGNLKIQVNGYEEEQSSGL